MGRYLPNLSWTMSSRLQSPRPCGSRTKAAGAKSFGADGLQTPAGRPAPGAPLDVPAARCSASPCDPLTFAACFSLRTASAVVIPQRRNVCFHAHDFSVFSCRAQPNLAAANRYSPRKIGRSLGQQCPLFRYSKYTVVYAVVL